MLAVAMKDVERSFDVIDERYNDELDPGTRLLGGQYAITAYLNNGGFGITYLAKDSLDRNVVIKECFPTAMCRRSGQIVHARSRAHSSSFTDVVKLFMTEALNQSKLVHPNIAAVHEVFRDNNTAYMSIDYIDGADLMEIIEDGEAISPETVEHWLRKCIAAIGFVHDHGILHRDISPDNILIDKNDEPFLIDFGAARDLATRKTRALSTLRVVKAGYSPHELYVSGCEQTPASDLYALAATFYHVISGEAPADAQMRLSAIAQDQNDLYTPLAGRIEGYPDALLRSIDKALSVLPGDRLQSAAEWLAMMDTVPLPEITQAGPVEFEPETITRAVVQPTVPTRQYSQLSLVAVSALVVSCLAVLVSAI